MSMILDDYDPEEDIVGNRVGPFSELRKQLWDIGAMVLPDPIQGFMNPEDEKKSYDLIARFNERYIHTLIRDRAA